MKNLKSLIGIAIILSASACTSTYHAGSTAQDDVYYSTKNNPAPAQQTYPATPPASANDYSSNNNNYNQDNQSNQYSDQNQGTDQNSNDSYNSTNDYSAPSNQYSTSSQSTDGQGNTYITNNYYDDYYDYEYSSRIRRFYTPAIGYAYYDPYYTNSYWYDYSPNSWGVSIYLGYNWWAPTYYYTQPFCYGGGFGYGYSSYWGYNPYWNSGWYGGGYHHGYHHGYNNGYYNGYNDGYWNGYYAGNTNPYYYNSYDDNSHYYGPRGSVGGNTPRGSSGRTVGTIGQKFETAVAQGKIPRTGTTDLDVRGTSLDRPGKTVQPRGELNNSQIGKGNSDASTPSRENIPAQTRPSKTDVKNSDDRGAIGKPSNNGDVKNTNDRGVPGKTNTGEMPATNDSKNQNVRPGTQPVNPRNNNNNGDIRNTTPPKQNNNQQTTPRQNNQENQQTTPRQNNNQPSNPRQNNIQQNQNQNYNSRPETNPRQNNNQNNYQNNNQNGDSRNNNINSRPDNAQPKSNSGQINDNSRNTFTPKQEPVREQNYKQPQKEINPTPRNESRTPIFQPRNEPKQYKQEKSNDFQRSAPSNPAPSSPAPSRGNNSNNNNGGGKRR